MLTDYHKMIGTLVGAAIGAAVSLGVLPQEWATPEVQIAIVTLISVIGTYLAPKNTVNSNAVH